MKVAIWGIPPLLDIPICVMKAVIPNCNWVQHHPLCHVVKISTHSNWKQGDGPLAGNSWVNLNWHEAGLSNMYQISDWKRTWMSYDSKQFVQKRFETFRFKALIRHGPQPKRARWIFKSCLLLDHAWSLFLYRSSNSSTLCKGAGRWYTGTATKPMGFAGTPFGSPGDMAPGLEHVGCYRCGGFVVCASNKWNINWASSQSVKPHIGKDSKMGCQTNSLWFAWKKLGGTPRIHVGQIFPSFCWLGPHVCCLVESIFPIVRSKCLLVEPNATDIRRPSMTKWFVGK